MSAALHNMGKALVDKKSCRKFITTGTKEDLTRLFDLAIALATLKGGKFIEERLAN
ncbi:hypothetical protein KHA80_11740 [Anaerobacillus sp. HL2]|nr:hypothetical protein KHA80_11740 [Anaerobacillus sp. HL2]